MGELWSYPDLFPGVRGGGRCFGATNGHALNSYSPPRRMIPAVRRRTTDASSKRFSESCAPVAHVATCPQNWVIGTGHICAPRAGSKRVSGSAWQPHCKAMLTWSNCSSTRSSCAPTSIPPAPKKAGQQEINRSRGGLTTKLHVAMDAFGNPTRVVLSAGQIADIERDAALIQDQPAEFIVADKGSDSDALVAAITRQGSHAVIPPRSNRLIRLFPWKAHWSRTLPSYAIGSFAGFLVIERVIILFA